MKTLLALILLGVAIQASAMRCGNNLVTEGLNVSQVLSICGTPTGVSQDSRTRSYDALYYKQDNGMYYTIWIVNNMVTHIDENRSL